MPRKRSDENLARVVSSNISPEVFATLQKYTKIYYNDRLLMQPTISHLVRYILNIWTNQIKKKEKQDQKFKEVKGLLDFQLLNPRNQRAHPLSGNKI
jgi:hypothetical protein